MPPKQPRRRKATRQQRSVLAALNAENSFISAQELHAQMHQDGDPVGLATVYRALASFAEEKTIDVIRTDDGEALYRACSAEHHHHLVCRDCGKTVEVSAEDIEDWATQVAQHHGFSNMFHTIELFGSCNACAEENKRPRNIAGG